MYFASGSCTRVLPPNKRQKAPKIAWTRCPSYFSIPPSATQVAPTSLCKGGKKVYLFYSARFSHFIDSLKRVGVLLQPVFVLQHLEYLPLRMAAKRGPPKRSSNFLFPKRCNLITFLRLQPESELHEVQETDAPNL